MAHTNECCHHDENQHNHSQENSFNLKEIIKELTIATASFILLFVGIIMEHYQIALFQYTIVPIIWYGIPLIFVGLPVMVEAWKLALQKDFFNELSLMSIAAIGACIIGKYSEALGLMVFYTLGEVAQSYAVSKSRNNIKSLLDVRPDTAHIVQDGDIILTIRPEEVTVGNIIEVYAGEKIPLDGILLTDKAFFNTVSLTGESVPRSIKKSEEVLAGMLSSDKTVRIQVTKSYQNSTLSRILKMVEDSVQNKAPTEQFIRKFARVYTPIVFSLAILVVVVPIFILGGDYVLQDWFYRSLIFLVISCPCALVISVPLGYFGGIGIASHNGILFKGSNFLEAITSLKTLVTDKTGTMTKGVFTIQEIISEDSSRLLQYLASLESHSTHPIATTIVEYGQKENIKILKMDDVTEVAGFGLKGHYQGLRILVGNHKLMEQHQIIINPDFTKYVDTLVFVALEQEFLGFVVVADSIKTDALKTTKKLHELGVKIMMLSGDKKEIVQKVAQKLSIDEAHGEMLPDEKAEFVLNLKQQYAQTIAFVGDGINDAPVLALSDIGIAMGGIGSDLAVETADMIIQNDEPSKIPLAILIAKATRSVVLQNITLAMLTKVVVLILGVNGLTTMWEAIFADVGVSLIATLNSSRLLYKKFDGF
ncbi:MAG: heavy metal translocating P-type ATPase [Brevinema sp.]